MKKLLAATATVALAVLGVVAAPMVAHADGIVSGTVIDADTNAPIDNATVTFSNPGFSINAFTDATGDYSLNLSDGTYTVQATASGYGREFWAGSASSSTATSITVAGGNIANIDFTLEEESEIIGTVRDSDNVPVAGAHVDAYYLDGRLAGSDTTDASGGYAIAGLGATMYRVRASQSSDLNLIAEWWPNAYVQTGAVPVVMVTPGTDATGIDFTLDEGARITGELTNTIGTPIPEYLSSERVDDPDNSVMTSGTADPTTGEYLLEAMYTGDWRVTVDHYDFWQPFEQVVSVTHGAAPIELDIELEPTPLDEPAFTNLLAGEPALVPVSGDTTFEAGTPGALTVESIGAGDTYAFLYTAADTPLFLGAVTPTGNDAAFTLTIPSDTPAGDYWLVFTGHDDSFRYFDDEAWLPIEVTEAADPAGLPATGVDGAALTGFAALLLLGGGAALALQRRRADTTA